MCVLPLEIVSWFLDILGLFVLFSFILEGGPIIFFSALQFEKFLLTYVRVIESFLAVVHPSDELLGVILPFGYSVCDCTISLDSFINFLSRYVNYPVYSCIWL